MPYGEPGLKNVANKPYQQGGLDSLCGIYAIINAFKWGLRDLSPLTKKKCKHLHSTLSEYLENQGLLSSAVNNGISYPDLGQLIKVSGECICKEKSIIQTTRKPFHSKRGVNIQTLSLKLQSHLAAPHAAAIIVTTGRMDHWTVATGISRSSIILSDSAGLLRLRLRNCTCAQPSKGRGRTLQIVPSGLFLIRFNPLG